MAFVYLFEYKYNVILDNNNLVMAYQLIFIIVQISSKAYSYDWFWNNGYEPLRLKMVCLDILMDISIQFDDVDVVIIVVFFLALLCQLSKLSVDSSNLLDPKLTVHKDLLTWVA